MMLPSKSTSVCNELDYWASWSERWDQAQAMSLEDQRENPKKDSKSRHVSSKLL